MVIDKSFQELISTCRYVSTR